MTTRSQDQHQQQQQPLYASGGHYIPVSPSGPHEPWSSAVMKRAQDIKVGDWLWVHDAFTNETISGQVGFDLLVLSRVVGISIKPKRGLYNPYTLSGTIIVNGVVASAYSDWFLDTAITPKALLPYLPTIYHTITWPARGLFHVMGPEKARAFDEQYLTPMLNQGSYGHSSLGFMHIMMAAIKHALFVTTDS